MIPQANDDFEDALSGPLILHPRPTPTAIDLVNPFTSLAQQDISDDLAIPRETQLTDDPRTADPRHSSFQTLSPGTIVGENYKIDARLGAGAMGEIYAAHHVKLGKQVAIKLIARHLAEDSIAIWRFTLEVRALAQIQHPTIVAIEHAGELPDGRAYYVMEYLHGESLAERLARGRVPLREALYILDQMARGLEAAHRSDVIHRDLKPENTFLVYRPKETPAIKLLDFGLAKLTAESDKIDPRSEHSQSGVMIGTPRYMSPEQARGDNVDHRTDIYALGCVAYELVLGALPFPNAGTAPEICAAHLHESPPLPQAIWPEIPPPLDRILFAMLAKDPELRPTLAKIRSILASLRTSTPSQQAVTTLVRPRPPRRAMRRAVITVAAVSALLIGAALGATFGTALASRRAVPLPAPTKEKMPGPVPAHK